MLLQTAMVARVWSGLFLALNRGPKIGAKTSAFSFSRFLIEHSEFVRLLTQGYPGFVAYVVRIRARLPA